MAVKETENQKKTNALAHTITTPKEDDRVSYVGILRALCCCFLSVFSFDRRCIGDLSVLIRLFKILDFFSASFRFFPSCARMELNES